MAGQDMMPFMTPPSPRGGLALIAVFKLLKGVVLLLVGARSAPIGRS